MYTEIKRCPDCGEKIEFNYSPTVINPSLVKTCPSCRARVKIKCRWKKKFSSFIIAKTVRVSN